MFGPTATGTPITAYPLELLGLLATPTRGAPIVLTPSIAIPEEYNDNIFLDNNNRQWDFITGFTPAVTLLINQPLWDLQAGYSFTSEIYAKESQFSDALSRMSLLGEFTLRRS